MFPTGSRLLVAATALATLVFVIYATTVWGALGTTGLAFLSAALGLLAGITLFLRDADVSVKDEAATTESAAARTAPQSSHWPIVGATGGVLLVVGLVTYPVVFVFGMIALLATTVEWMVEAWSERASSDRSYNLGVRERVANPAEFPVLAALGTGIVVYSFSRVMLFLSKTGGPIVFGVVAALVLAAGFAVAYRPQLRSATVSGVAAIAVIGLVAGGVAAALAGERELHPHETTGALAEHGECGEAHETHADANASQTVGAKANITAEVRLRADGTLEAKSTGIDGWSKTVVVARSNATNIVFHNESGHERRLVLDMGTAAKVDDETEATIPGETQPLQICTALAEDGGAQFLTFKLGKASSDDTVYKFIVPGVEGQEIEVVVP